jgi:hypothetical protein
LSEGIKDKAARYKNLQEDETFLEVLEIVLEDQVNIFLASDSLPDEIEQARNVALALKKIADVIQSAIDEETFYDNKTQH